MGMGGGRFAAATIALAACGTTLPEAGDGTPSTSDVDASSDAGGSLDTGASTSTVVDDAGDADTAVDADSGGPGPGCTRAVDETFAQAPASPWFESASGGDVSHVTDAGVGALGALRAEVFSGGAATNAQIRREVTGLPKAVKLAFAMRAPNATSEYFEVGCTLQLKSSDTTFFAIQPEIAGNALQIDSTKRNAGQLESTGAADQIGPVDGAHWYAISIQVTGITASGGNVAVVVDGAMYYGRTITFPQTPDTIRLKCGIDHGAIGGAATVLVDDVVLDVCP